MCRLSAVNNQYTFKTHKIKHWKIGFELRILEYKVWDLELVPLLKNHFRDLDLERLKELIWESLNDFIDLENPSKSNFENVLIKKSRGKYSLFTLQYRFAKQIFSRPAEP